MQYLYLNTFKSIYCQHVNMFFLRLRYAYYWLLFHCMQMSPYDVCAPFPLLLIPLFSPRYILPQLLNRTIQAQPQLPIATVTHSPMSLRHGSWDVPFKSPPSSHASPVTTCSSSKFNTLNYRTVVVHCTVHNTVLVHCLFCILYLF